MGDKEKPHYNNTLQKNGNKEEKARVYGLGTTYFFVTVLIDGAQNIDCVHIYCWWL